MSNYTSYIHISRLWPARPVISLIDAERETWAPSLSTPPPRKVAWSVLACHPSPFPLDCRRCVTVPLTDHWPRWGHAGGWSNISARSVTSRREDRKTRCDPRRSDIFIDTEPFMQGGGGVLPARLAVLKGQNVKAISEEAGQGLDSCRRTETGRNATTSTVQTVQRLSTLKRSGWFCHLNCRMWMDLDLL